MCTSAAVLRPAAVPARGLIDEMELHLVPQVLGAGERLFGNLDGADIKLEQTRVIETTEVTHLKYRVLK